MWISPELAKIKMVETKQTNTWKAADLQRCCAPARPVAHTCFLCEGKICTASLNEGSQGAITWKLLVENYICYATFASVSRPFILFTPLPLSRLSLAEDCFSLSLNSIKKAAVLRDTSGSHHWILISCHQLCVCVFVRVLAVRTSVASLGLKPQSQFYVLLSECIIQRPRP